MATFKAINDSLLLWLNGLANSSLAVSNLIVFCAVYLGFFLVVMAAVYVWRGRSPLRRFRVVILALIAGFLSLLTTDLIKNFFPYPRPEEILPAITPLFIPGDGQSFPSGHAAFFGAWGLTLYLADRSRGKYFLFFCLLVGVARVAAGVHWPFDILVGWAIAMAIVWAVKWLIKMTGH